MKDLKEINLFIASPGDVKEERKIVRNVCEELNKSTLLRPYGICFHAIGWEEVIPSAGRPQEIINKLVDECDFFVCIFHKRFGSPTGKEEAGTLEEFLIAYDSWKSLKKPHVMFYFKEVMISSKKDLENEQIQKVFYLKDKIEQENLLLYSEFSTPEEFKEKIKDHLEKWTVENSKGWERIADKIEKAFEEDKIFKNYLRSALNEHRHLPTQGFETILRVPVELESVYINMHAHIHGQELEFNRVGKEVKKRSEEKEKNLSSLDIKAAFNASERHKIKDIVILGDPGSGKTMLLKYILVMLIEGKGKEKIGLEKNIFPFFAPLRELKNPDNENFVDFIRRVCNLKDYSISEHSFGKLLNDGGGIILLDGLDEVMNVKTRIKICRWIDRARKRFANSRFVITSRYAGYMDSSRLEGNVVVLSIKNLTMDEVREFLVRWFETVERSLHFGQDEAKWKMKGRHEATLLFERINKSEHLKQLAINPILLHLIVLVHRDRGSLPQRRVELYEESINVLLEKWDMAKGLDILLTSRELRQILQPLALWFHKNKKISASIEEIEDVIKKPLEVMGKSDLVPYELLLSIRDRSGIIVENSVQEFGFIHLIFQEYFVAEQIRSKGLIDILITHYNDTWWREVILLSLALNNPSIIEEFMWRIIPTEYFLTDINLVINAIKDSIYKPSQPFIDAMNNKAFSSKIRQRAIIVLKEIGGDKVIKALKEAKNIEDVKLAHLAYESYFEKISKTVESYDKELQSKASAHLFLSYAREDNDRVINLYTRLLNGGYKPWMDKKDILPGEKWELRIEKAIRNSDFFLVCLSQNSVRKRGVFQKEIKQALHIWEEQFESDIYLIPVRLEDCDVPESLSNFQWVNLFEEDGFILLLKAIQEGMKRRIG